METASIELWHGSSHVIKHPEYGLVKPNNDFILIDTGRNSD